MSETIEIEITRRPGSMPGIVAVCKLQAITLQEMGLMLGCAEGDARRQLDRILAAVSDDREHRLAILRAYRAGRLYSRSLEGTGAGFTSIRQVSPPGVNLDQLPDRG